MRRIRLVAIAATLGLGAVLAVGCATTVVAPPPADQSPAASSAAGAVQRFAWGFNHKDVEVIDELLTDDFQFITTGIDSAGNPTRGPGESRSWFLVAMAALRDSTSSVTFAIDRNLLQFSDTRLGKDPRCHKQVRSSVDVKVFAPASGLSVEVSGHMLFFLTRGDSAAIPLQLLSRGVKPDSTRWWLDRLEDETLAGPGGFATQPSRIDTFAAILQYFHSLVAH
jgi:hypothetical protein